VTDASPRDRRRYSNQPEESSNARNRPATAAGHEEAKKPSKYREMVESLQKIVDRDNQSDEEEEDFGDEQIKFNFVTPEGLPIPGITQDDSAYAKIEGLRLYLENQLGTDRIINAYSYMTDPPEGEEDSE
jgi:hypothetical protein